MQTYTKVYLEKLDLDTTDFICCEVCESKATEIHHILARSKYKEHQNDIENLMAICRKCHQEYGDQVYLMEALLKIHQKRLDIAKVKYDKNFFRFYNKKYKNKTDLKK